MFELRHRLRLWEGIRLRCSLTREAMLLSGRLQENATPTSIETIRLRLLRLLLLDCLLRHTVTALLRLLMNILLTATTMDIFQPLARQRRHR